MSEPIRMKINIRSPAPVPLAIKFNQRISLGTRSEMRPVYTDLPPYEGEYAVTPNGDEQVLPTINKRMEDDVTVHAIPYYETTNESGGYTVIIG